MRFADIDCRPGRVLRVDDNYGTVRCSCEGWFDENADPETLPPAGPFFKTSTTSFSTPHEGDLLWVLVNTTNPQEVRWMFFGDASSNNGSTLSEGENDASDYEILSKRGEGENIKYSDKEGYSIESGSAKTNVSEEGIKMTTNGGDMFNTMTGDHITMGREGAAGPNNGVEPAVRGDHLVQCLNNIYDMLGAIADAAQPDPHTAAIAAAIKGRQQPLKSSIDPVKSEYVSLT